jgi:hypothetical protein
MRERTITWRIHGIAKYIDQMVHNVNKIFIYLKNRRRVLFSLKVTDDERTHPFLAMTI